MLLSKKVLTMLVAFSLTIITQVNDSRAAGVLGADINNSLGFGISSQISNLNTDLKSAGSLSAAISSLKPMAYDPSQPTSFMLGVGTYGGNKALAIGINHYVNDNLAYNAGIAMADKGRDKFMANVGLSVKFGKGKNKEENSDVISEVETLQNKVITMENTISILEKKLKEVMKKNAELESKVKA